MSCPECEGPRLPRHPAGPLVLFHTPVCQLGASEDARRAADAENAVDAWRPWTRATTPTERQLLAHLCDVQAAAVPDEVTVTAVAGSAVVRRTWVGLDPDERTETP